MAFSLTRDNLVAQVRTYAGVPFQHIGRTRDGVDCIGLIVCALQDLGWVPREPGSALLQTYRRWPDSSSLTQAIESECFQVQFDEVRPADIILMKWAHTDELPRHVALVTSVEPVRIIHTHWLMPNQKVSEHILDDTWKTRLVSCWRMRDFAESQAVKEVI